MSCDDKVATLRVAATYGVINKEDGKWEYGMEMWMP
jgi:hypothetical protein